MKQACFANTNISENVRMRSSIRPMTKNYSRMKKIPIFLLVALFGFGSCNIDKEEQYEPIAVSFTANPSAPYTGEGVIFQNLINGINQPDSIDEESDTIASEPIAGNSSYSCAWAFGDGTAQSYEKNPTHIFTKAGYYTVRLLVRKENNTNSFSQKFYVGLYNEANDKNKVEEAWANPDIIEQIVPGVILKKMIFSEEKGNQIFRSNQTVSILIVDQNANSNLKFAIDCEGNGKITKKTTVRSVSRNALAATNGTMWNFNSVTEANAAQAENPSAAVPSWASTIVSGNNSRDYIRVTNPLGNKVIEVPNYNPELTTARTDRRTAAIVIDANGKLDVISTVGKTYDYESTLVANDIMASGPILINNNTIYEMGSNELNDGRNPRTAYAITNDSKVLMIAVDGRRTNARGMNLISELSNFLKWINCKNAMNCDGGGSTTLCIRGRVTDFGDGIVNNPTDVSNGVSVERSVFNSILLLDENSFLLQ